MGFLDRFEKNLERLVNGAFSKTFKSELQPLEIASAIKNQMDSHASVVSRERILVPNHFKVTLSSADFNRLRALGEHLLEELNDAANRHALKQKYQFGSALKIDIAVDSALAVGQLNVSSSTAKVDVEWTPALEIDGQRYIITQERTTVGRDAAADINVNDTRLSRTHFEILWDGKNAGLRDLGSTNGTRLSGKLVAEAALPADSVITAGASQFVFRVIAKAVGNE
ncbi:MAG: DUF3662 and FHA domain-containing protein [Rhodoluna sp.]|nr:DUF3662 and FHA domain-containing protein [Rhodoluna sp.]